MKLYKFRTISINEHFKYVKEILNEKKFHMSSWNELNDPMEGVFEYIKTNSSDPYYKKIENVIKTKITYKVCSFSKTISPILLWAIYADNLKGIAIEVTFNYDEYKNKLFEIKYRPTIKKFKYNTVPLPIELLKQKIKIWKFEEECRIIDNSEEIDSFKIGKITGIYLGLRFEQNLPEKVDYIKKRLDKSIKINRTEIDFDNNKIFVAKDKIN